MVSDRDGGVNGELVRMKSRRIENTVGWLCSVLGVGR